MATAYAALVSLNNLIDQIQVYHARQPIFHNEQLKLIESLQKAACYLQSFLEGYGTELDGLESKIANAAYVAHDLIDSFAIDDTLSRHQKEQGWHDLKGKFWEKLVQFPYKAMLIVMGKKTCRFDRGLEKVVNKLDSIREDVEKVMEKRNLKDQYLHDQDPLGSFSTCHAGKDTIVEFGDELVQMIGKLTVQPESDLQIIPITGMGGIGKTTLAKSIYDNPLVMEHFDMRAYVTVSQEYNLQKKLYSLLRDMGAEQESCESDECHVLGLRLHKHLLGRRYLIVLDDIWGISAWHEFKRFFPGGSCGSCVIVTTRLSEVANEIGSSHEMNLLDEEKSWRLLCKKVFGENDCPPELTEIGKSIARGCKGLPLSIAAVGGLLTKSTFIPNEWRYYAENINKVLNSGDDDYCLEILSLSYEHLPIHLKPCFLHVGVYYPEDHAIRVSELVRLWVAEGFLKPVETKSLEETGKEYLKNLVDRHLISVVKRGSLGEMKICIIHDLFRSLCLKEALKERFFSATDVNRNTLCINSVNCSVLDEILSRYDQLEASDDLSTKCMINVEAEPCSQRSKRVVDWDMDENPTPEFILKLINSRCLTSYQYSQCFEIPLPMHRLWNLQTIIITGCYRLKTMPVIWNMPQLRHLIVKGGIRLSDPQKSGYEFVLENLQTVSFIWDFVCIEDVITRIPNIEELEICYHYDTKRPVDYCLHNLSRFNKLLSLNFKDFGRRDFRDVVLPDSLKKLTLRCNFISWEDVARKIGSLPHLEKLHSQLSQSEERWIPVDEQFLRLKVLRICAHNGLKDWEIEATHFPVLETLVIIDMKSLQEIPSSFGDIPTLQLIALVHCRDSIVISAKKIIEEQHSYGNYDLQMTVS